MMEAVIQSSLSNIAIIFFMHLSMMVLMNNKDRLSPFLVSLGMITLFSSAVIAMFYLPIRYGEYRFDLRLIPLVFLALRWGWKMALPALLVASVWRLGLGGEGSIPGVVFGMMLPVFCALLVKFIRKSAMTPFPLFVLISVCWLISDMPILIFVPNGGDVFREIMVVRYTSLVVTALIYHFFINDAVKNDRLKQQLQYYAEHDPLTGLFNLRSFEAACKQIPAGDHMYIAMLDVDHFKLINDTHGHQNGDMVLKRIAEAITAIASKGEKAKVVCGRYGGEEFILHLTVQDADEMKALVENIRKTIEAIRFSTEKGGKLAVTASIGVSRLESWATWHQAIGQADQALYEAKTSGRNQIRYHESVQ